MLMLIGFLAHFDVLSGAGAFGAAASTRADSEMTSVIGVRGAFLGKFALDWAARVR